MAHPIRGASAPISSEQAESREILVKRDGNRPISFAGRTIAEVSMPANGPLSGAFGPMITAALHVTQGGKFVSTLSKSNPKYFDLGASELFGGAIEESPSRSGEFNKAQVFDNFENAVSWFRPGRLTDALLEKLGLNQPERIE